MDRQVLFVGGCDQRESKSFLISSVSNTRASCLVANPYCVCVRVSVPCRQPGTVFSLPAMFVAE